MEEGETERIGEGEKRRNKTSAIKDSERIRERK